MEGCNGDFEGELGEYVRVLRGSEESEGRV